MHNSKSQLEKWKYEINNFLKEKLKLELHKEKSKIILLSRGIDFVGFRNFYYFKLLRRRNIKNMENKMASLNNGEISYKKFIASLQGWLAYAKWADSYIIVNKILKKMRIE